MSDKKSIDQFFKDGSQTDYPFDEKLWQDVAGTLDSKKKFVFWKAFSIGLICFIAAGVIAIRFWPTNETKVSSSRVEVVEQVTTKNAEQVKQKGNSKSQALKMAEETPSTKSNESEKTIDQHPVTSTIEHQKQAQPHVNNSNFKSTNNSSKPNVLPDISPLELGLDERTDNYIVNAKPQITNNLFSLTLLDPLQSKRFKSPKVQHDPDLPDLLKQKRSQKPWSIDLGISFGLGRSSDMLKPFQQQRVDSGSVQPNSFELAKRGLNINEMAINGRLNLKQWNVGLGIGMFNIQQRFTSSSYSNSMQTIKTDSFNYILVKDSVPTDGRFITYIKKEYETADVEVTDTLTEEVKVQVKTLQIPIHLGYNYEYKKWGFGAIAGIDVLIPVQASGAVPLGNGEMLHLSKQTVSATSLMFKGGLQLEYRISEQMRLQNTWYFRKQHASFAPSVMNQFTAVGGTFGLIYRLP